MIIRWIPNWVIGTCRARIRGRGSAGQAGAWAAIAGLLALQVYCARLGGQHWSSWLLPFMGRLGRPHDSLGDQRGWTAGMADASVRRISRSPSAWIAKTFPARRVPSPASTAAAASRSATNQVIRAVPAAADSSATRSGPVRKLQRPPGKRRGSRCRHLCREPPGFLSRSGGPALLRRLPRGWRHGRHCHVIPDSGRSRKTRGRSRKAPG